jgi:glycerol uptake facilitator-like aquaporin
MDKNLRPYLAELIGTFAFVFLTAGAVCVNGIAALAWAAPDVSVAPTDILQARGGLLGIALVAGFAYAGALAFTLPFANGYLNPAVPLTLWVFKRLDGKPTIGLIGAQLLGAFLAGLLLRVLLAFNEQALVVASLGTPHLNLAAFGALSVSVGTVLRGIAIELVLTFVLVFAIFGTMLDPRAPKLASGWVGRLAPLWLGLIVVAATLVAFPLTGAALNPARWFGPVVWESSIVPLLTRGPFRDHAVFWIGPLAGALVAGTLYTTLVLPPPREEHHHHHDHAAPPAKPPVSSTLFRAKK